MATHENEPKYKCEVNDCNYSCRSVITLKKHFNSTHLRTAAPIYQCHLCEKEYNRGPSLGTHLRTVHKLERLPGHSRFRCVQSFEKLTRITPVSFMLNLLICSRRYMENKDGYYRLQVERYETLDQNNFKGISVSYNCQININLEEQPTENVSVIFIFNLHITHSLDR